MWETIGPQKKLDVFVDVPDEIDIEFLRGHGKQVSEELLPEEIRGAPSIPDIVVDEGIVTQLMNMGFSRARCERAAFFTKNANVDIAMNWIFEHTDDADVDTPLPKPSVKGGFVVNEEAVVMLSSMGFSREQATKALKETDNNVERATEWIFSHMDDLNSMEVEPQSSTTAAQKTPQFSDGKGAYRLVAFVSHMGSSTQSGHYVAHIWKEGNWVLFNDSKVAISENPPKNMGYIYIFQRKAK